MLKKAAFNKYRVRWSEAKKMKNEYQLPVIRL